MKTRAIFTSSILFMILYAGACGQDYKYLTDPVTGITPASGIDKPVTLKVIYDNYSKKEEIRPGWGFSLLLEGLEKTILFDTGADPDIFAANFTRMGLSAQSVDAVVISHEHGDHTEGIKAFAGMKQNTPLVFPESFSDEFKKKMKAMGMDPVLVSQPAAICKNLFTSGEFKFRIPEQALVLNTTKGLVVITGCSHPGIIEMLKRIKTDFKKNIYMVLGGFHLLEKNDNEMNAIISEMKTMGIVKCGATHCTGEKQIDMFRAAFGKDYFDLGAGNTIIIN